MRRLFLALAVLASCLLAFPSVALASDPLFDNDAPTPPIWWSPTVAPQASMAATPNVFVKVEGGDRVGTSIAASKLAFPGKADTVVMCTGWNWPDALGSSALAGACGGPLLLTSPGTLAPALAAEILRLDAHNLVIVGSEKVVSLEVENALKALDVNGHALAVTRLGGINRYETSAMVASATVDAMRSRGATYSGMAFVATGRNFSDALAASPIAARKGWPILLAEPSVLTTWTEDAIGRIGVTGVIILGSDKVVTTAVANRLTALLPAAPKRIWGIDRYWTAIQIARYGVAHGLSWDGVGVATGENFPDGLAGGVLQGRLGSVLVLTPGRYLRVPVFDELTSVRAGVRTARYFGGIKVLRQYARDGVAAALKGAPYPQTNWMTFPVDGPCNYSDTFGAPRSGGRTHEGTDIMAARYTPCVATLNGWVSSKEGGLGGRVIYLDADTGWRFYYAHLDSWAVRSGYVEAGQVIGYVGNTGNAAGGACHLHLQMWTPQGTLVNPYPYVRQMLR